LVVSRDVLNEGPTVYSEEAENVPHWEPGSEQDVHMNEQEHGPEIEHEGRGSIAGENRNKIERRGV